MAKKRRKKARRRAFIKKLTLLLIFVCIAAVAWLFIKGGKPSEPVNTEPAAKVTAAPEVTAEPTPVPVPEIRITEVMTSNASVIHDDTGVYADWIELTNVSGTDAALAGWRLVKQAEGGPYYCELTEGTLAPGESCVVFCGNADDALMRPYQAPFKLSASGDSVSLEKPDGTLIQTLEIPQLDSNRSYALIDDEWIVTDAPTPGKANTQDNYSLMMASRRIQQGSIVINEVMAKNASYAPDEDGEYPDWVEIYNASQQSVNLMGCAISDNSENPRKWTFPDVQLQPGGYIIVYCSSKNRGIPGSDLHTGFRLSADGGCVILTDSFDNELGRAEYTAVQADQSLSRLGDGTYTLYKSPTPGMANTFENAALISAELESANTYGIFISEVMASTSTTNVSKESYDWIELRNTGSEEIDLSGWGLSDNPAKPLKWVFPEGTKLGAGKYLGIYLSGKDGLYSGYLHTNFSLSAEDGETVALSAPDGTLVDRCPLGRQYCDISYGRISGRSGFYYMTSATPGTANAGTGCEYRLETPVFSKAGGVFDSSEPFTLSLSCEAGAEIYYTLDCSEPDTSNLKGSKFKADPNVSVNTTTRTYKYTGPIAITSSMVVRAIAVKSGCITSQVETQTYLLGVSHTMNVVSLVMNPKDLWDYNEGIYVKGPNATSSAPYGSINKGANFWMTWEKTANVEMFDTDGNTVLSQGCGVKLHGQYSRSEKQKAFKVIARSRYGNSTFNAALFPNRDYTEYQSFLLRASGQDWDKTRMRDSLLSSLAEGMGVMYQDTALCVVYLNGQFWGQYNMRERINTYSICQWEGWDTDDRDNLDLLKANSTVMQGSADTFKALKEWYTKNGIGTAEKLAYVEQYIDVKNYLNYCAVQIFTGNTDLLNCKKYRNADADGKWRFILFDFDWAFFTDTNSVRRWLTPGGVGEQNKYDNSLFIALMKNSECRDYFLSLFAEKMRTTWTTESLLSMIEQRYNELEPEMDAHLKKWGVARSTYKNALTKFKNYAKTRPGRLLYFFKNALDKKEFEKYFGDLARDIQLIDDKGKTSSYYK